MTVTTITATTRRKNLPLRLFTFHDLPYDLTRIKDAAN
ncbi:MAG: hypothetical protein BSOLF_0795 [Candidatus Carbobacillus altaicus]|uniref:Uncharacterized protein n=1 Tax=Candidatus Carbonibacillus altaicus TaxID=2163959 RepID=A0A2R6XXA1_9BACL|nr:MAG: hypothetical protein BSOLF_0795 [Candidatus Carbobacillus altaicus]